MRRAVCLLAAGLVLLVSPPSTRAWGQTGGVSLDLGGGFAAPVGELAELHEAGPTVRAAVALGVTRRLSGVVEAGLTALGDPSRKVWHTGVGARMTWIAPPNSRFVLSSDLTAGAASMTSPGVLTVGRGRARVQLLDDALSLRTSTRAAYRLDGPLRVFFEAGALLMLTGFGSAPRRADERRPHARRPADGRGQLPPLRVLPGLRASFRAAGAARRPPRVAFPGRARPPGGTTSAAEGPRRGRASTRARASSTRRPRGSRPAGGRTPPPVDRCS